MEVGYHAEQFARLAAAARQEQHLGARHEHRLHQAQHGHDGRFAHLPATVQQQPLVPGIEQLFAECASPLHSRPPPRTTSAEIDLFIN
jgi:hypothetical protein